MRYGQRRMSILKYFGLEPSETARAAAETDSVRRITEALDRLDPERARYIAGFAYELSRVARASWKKPRVCLACSAS